MIKNDRVGEVGTNNQDLKMEIVEYRKHSDIDVKFEDGYVFKNTRYDTFKKGEIKSPYYPETCGVGFVGEGDYKTTENGKHTKEYNTWYDMLRRCYSEKRQEKQPTYKGCTVCEEWLCFQTFAKWYEDSLWSEDCTILDKDILIKGNKIYSSQTCILVDRRLNLLFTKSDKARGEYPIGVCYDKNAKKFVAMCSIFVDGKKQHKFLKRHNTMQEAFNAYKDFKEYYIKQIANEYKNKYVNFPKKLYQTMYNYEVSIND